MSTLGAATIKSATIHIPPSGGWLADVVLLADPAPTGQQTITIGNLSLVGTVLPGRGGDDIADRPHVTVAGGAGWGSLIARPGSYYFAGGVRLSAVLRDLATAAGEPYDAPADSTLGKAFSWDAATPQVPRRLRSVLSDLVALRAIPTWRVAPNGRTRFDAWPATGEAKKLGEVISRNLGPGIRRIGLDARVSDFLPGATVEGVRVARTIIVETSGKLFADVWES